MLIAVLIFVPMLKMVEHCFSLYGKPSRDSDTFLRWTVVDFKHKIRLERKTVVRGAGFFLSVAP